MRDLIVNVSALLVSISLLLLGNGLQMTLLGVRAQIEGFSTAITGFMMSAYFVGYIIGALNIPKLVSAVGHIRVFVALASICSVSAILHVVWLEPLWWVVLRVITGFCLVGLYLVTESWLNEESSNENRGRVFSTYMVINLASVGLGQQLLQVAEPSGYGLFIIGTVLFSLAVVPISLVPVKTPITIPSERMKIKKLFEISPVGTVGSFLSGMINGAFWGMAAVYLYAAGYGTAQIANFMMIVVFGGMALQWPLGRLSDKTDRRHVIMLICIGIALASLIIMNVDTADKVLFYSAGFLYGGFLLTVNSLCTAHTNDFMKPKDFVQASGALLMLFGIGAIIGPYLVSLLMEHFGNNVFFAFSACISSLLLVYTVYRRFVREAPDVTVPFRPVSMATQHLIKLQKTLNEKTRSKVRGG